MLTNQLFEQHVSIRSGRCEHSDINRLLAAAVVSRQFCNVLLSDPARAISMGYAGEQFSLSSDEYNLVLGAQGSSLPEFAQHVSKHLTGSKLVAKPALSENYQLRI
ncbi:MAG: hypothetical protein NTW32_07060 [Chloroflexi bacterium]|nr:hypothetical protein [Chloroflexota bacterium]